MSHRILRGALGAALLVVLSGCSEQVSGSLGCPELCSDQSAQLRDTVLTGVVTLDTTLVGFPRFGDPTPLTLVTQGDTADVRLVARFDTLPSLYRATGATVDSTITRVDSAALIVAIDSTLARPAGQLLLEAFDVDTTAADTLPAALLPLFRADRLLGSLSFQVSSGRDTLRVPLSNAAILDKARNGRRLRIGLRLTGGSGPEARRVRILRTPAPIVRFRVSPDTLVLADTVRLLSLTPRELPDVANALLMFPVIARGTLPPPASTTLAVGGVAGARGYLRFEIPPIVLDSVQVIRATLQLTQRPSRAPGSLRDTVSFVVNPVIAGPAIADVFTASQFFASPVLFGIDTLRLAPRDSGLRRVELVNLVRTWRALGSANTSRALVLRVVEEGELPGELDFFSSEASPALRPTLRLTYVPRRGFGIP